MKSTLLPIFLLIILTSCGYGNDKSSDNSKSNYPLMLDNAQLTVPEGWIKSAPTNNLRVAQLDLEQDPSIQMAVFFFGQQSMVEENIERWKTQFTEISSYSELQIPQQKNIVAVKIMGTYKKKDRPMAQEFTEEPNYGTLAAIVPSNSGPYYIKLSASESIINQQQDAFIQMLSSFKVTE